MCGWSAGSLFAPKGQRVRKGTNYARECQIGSGDGSQGCPDGRGERGAREVDDVIYRLTNVYDAGTEANTEEAATLVTAPGGEGFNAERDDVDFVAMHPGVVGNQDGLTNSALTGAHRFDNPAVKITVTRTE